MNKGNLVILFGAITISPLILILILYTITG